MSTRAVLWATIGRVQDLSLVVLSVVLVAAVVAAAGWRLNGDAAVMLYAAALQSDWGRVVYRDVFDMNAPGAHLAFRAIYGLTGGADTAIRGLDIACLLTLMGLTSVIVRRWGHRAMWSSAVLVGLVYLGAGDALSLQREFLLLIPTALALAILSGRSEPVLGATERVARAVGAGLCIGIASTIKPQAAVFVVVAVVALAGRRAGRQRAADAAVALVAALCGVVLAWVPVLAWLRSQGALDPFLDIARHYWPLYDAVTRRPYRSIQGWPRLMYLLEGYASGIAGPRLLWLSAAVGGAWVWRATVSDARRPPVLPLVIFLVVTLMFPGITGKFWDYHWLPFGYAAVLLASVAWATPLPHLAGTGGIAAVAMVLAVAGLPTRAWVADARRAGELQKTDALTDSLQLAMQPGDTVQPLDWTGVALHAMLRARAPLATRFMEDVHLYHHAGHPYMERLRATLLEEWQQAPPRLVIEVEARGWADGPSGRAPFPALEHLLESAYAVRTQGNDFIVYERVAPEASAVVGSSGRRARTAETPDDVEHRVDDVVHIPAQWRSRTTRLRSSRRAMSHGRPARCTGTIARVRGVIAASTACGSMFIVRRSTSTNTGRAPQCSTTFAVAGNVRGEVITSSPGATPITSRARCRAAVQELRPTACRAPTYAANRSSNSRVFGPVPSHPDASVSSTSATSSSPMRGVPNARNLSRTVWSLPACPPAVYPRGGHDA